MKESKEYNLGILALILTIMVMALCFACLPGCKNAPRPVVNNAPKVTVPLAVATNALTTISTETPAARTDIATVIKGTTALPVINAAARSADSHMVKVQAAAAVATTQVSVATVAAVKNGEDDVALQNERNALAAENAKLKSEFWSPREKRDFWIWGITFAILSITVGVLKYPALSSPLVWLFREILKAIVTFGGSLFVHLGHWGMVFVRWFHAKHIAPLAVAAKTITTASVSTLTTSTQTTPATGFVTGVTAVATK